LNPTNLQIANWLDPEHKRDGWWTSTRPDYELGGDNTAYFAATDKVKYTGPDFYDPAACAEEVEPVVLERCEYRRTFNDTEISIPFNAHFNEIVNHNHHPTACILALAKIKEADHA
jgi:hypothetical protein